MFTDFIGAEEGAISGDAISKALYRVALYPVPLRLMSLYRVALYRDLCVAAAVFIPVPVS